MVIVAYRRSSIILTDEIVFMDEGPRRCPRDARRTPRNRNPATSGSSAPTKKMPPGRVRGRCVMSDSTGQVLVVPSRSAPALSKGLGRTLGSRVFGTALQLVVPITVQRIIDSVLLGSGVDAQDVLSAGGLPWSDCSAVSCRAHVTGPARPVVDHGLANLHVTTFEYLHSSRCSTFNPERRGALVGHVTSDIETMQQFMEWGGIGMILGAAQITLAVLVMLIYDGGSPS